MFTVTLYTHWLSLREANEENRIWLTEITKFLASQEIVDAFAIRIKNQDVSNILPQEQVLAINQKLQPILNNIIVPMHIIKFGFYSRQHESIVAIGPQADASLLFSVDPSRFKYIYATNTDQFRESNNSLIWHGARTISHIRPIQKDGVILGHTFATINQDAIYTVIWKRTLHTFLAAFLMLLVCVAIFRELFVKLKNDLKLFAEAILDERANDFHSEIAEFTPILNYINEQTKKMTRLDRLNIIGEMAASNCS